MPQIAQRYRLNRRSDPELLHQDGGRDFRPVVDGRQNADDGRPGIAQSFSADQRRDHFRRRGARRYCRRGVGDVEGDRRTRAAGELFDRLRRAVTPVRAGIERLRGDVRLRADHHFSRPRGIIRELPRSADHSRLCADVDRRRAGRSSCSASAARASTSTRRSGSSR